jgi:hypothetical protein
MDRDGEEVRARLTDLANQIADELGNHVTVSRDSDGPFLEATRFVPTNPAALPVTWVDFGNQLDVWAGHNGGWWEDVGRDHEAVDFVEDLTRAVIAGRVVEAYGPQRSRVEVTLRDGTVRHETGYEGLRGLIPVPGWRRRAKRVQYEPYRA